MCVFLLCIKLNCQHDLFYYCDVYIGVIVQKPQKVLQRRTFYQASLKESLCFFSFVCLFLFFLFFYYFYYFILSLKFGLYKSIYYQILTALHFYELRATRAM